MKWIKSFKNPWTLESRDTKMNIRYNFFNAMVGFDKQLTSLMNKIRESGSERMDVIMPIVGMGGVGNTALATNVYKHPYALHRFDIRAWVTISQHYVVKNILDDQMDDERLGSRLQTKLCDGRYLIVLDDIWDIQAWDKIKMFFPGNKNGSRILLTTDVFHELDLSSFAMATT